MVVEGNADGMTTCETTETTTHRTSDTRILVAEGDSWFFAPPSLSLYASDVVTRLKAHGDVVESVAEPGHTLRSMVTDWWEKGEFHCALQRLIENGDVPWAVLFSGGGNDFKNRLPSLLNPKGRESNL